MSLLPTPVPLRRALMAWYRRNRRDLPWRASGDPYRIWVSEVMLQQTQVKTMLPYFTRFLERFPTLEALAKADLDVLLKSWEGLGFYARARHFHHAAQQVLARDGGEVPRDPERFRRLPGVGDYIAAAVQSIAFDRPLAVVDGNVKRVLARLFCIAVPVNTSAGHQSFRAAADALLDRRRPGLHNQALMELGALVCTPRRPNCVHCPLRDRCRALALGVVAEFPQRRPSRPIPERHFALGAIWRRGRLLVTRRPERGLLGGMWQFPGGEMIEGKSGMESCQRQVLATTGLTVTVARHLTQVRHAYTHFRVRLDLFACYSPAGPVRLAEATGFRWLLPRELAALPFGVAERKFMPILSDGLERAKAAA